MPSIPDAPHLERLGAFLGRLTRGYDRWQAETTVDLPQDLAPSLLLAAACLRDLESLRTYPERPPQIAVMGPTQVGKSTVVNALVGAEVAEVSPLAGFTIHPSAFSIGLRTQGEHWLEGFFPGWTRCALEALSSDRIDAYGLEHVDSAGLPPGALQSHVVWDTPDFDSLASRGYQQGVMEVAAMTDLIVLVLSREKYSDLSVWRMLDLLAPLGRRLLVCLNKSTPEAEAVIVPALRERLQSAYAGLGQVAIVSFPVWRLDPSGGESWDESAVGVLRQNAREGLAAGERRDRARGVHALMRAHWSAWTAPLRAQLAARRRWQADVERAAGAGVDAYRSEYLEHPHRYDSLRLVVAELLRLLEIPGVASSMMRLRRLLTWPARQVVEAWRGRRRAARMHPDQLSSEQRVLQDVLEQQLIALARDAARQEADAGVAAGFWLSLDRRLAQMHPELLQRFHRAAQAHQEAFANDIKASAQRLYERLQQHPALLNTLRATRFSADAAAIALAVKLGGLGINDLLFAPALVSVTSLLTEGALGSYVRHETELLKQRQSRAVQQQVFDAVFIPSLLGVAEDLDGPGVMSIAATELQAAEEALEALGRE